MKKIILAMVTVASMFFATPSFAGDAIDVNMAGVEQLQEVKGIGPKTAAAIVAYREEHGNFKSVEALTGVKGIGEKKLKKIEDELTVESKDMKEKE